jgi:hypothetical protein
MSGDNCLGPRVAGLLILETIAPLHQSSGWMMRSHRPARLLVERADCNGGPDSSTNQAPPSNPNGRGDHFRPLLFAFLQESPLVVRGAFLSGMAGPITRGPRRLRMSSEGDHSGPCSAILRCDPGLPVRPVILIQMRPLGTSASGHCDSDASPAFPWMRSPVADQRLCVSEGAVVSRRMPDLRCHPAGGS